MGDTSVTVKKRKYEMADKKKKKIIHCCYSLLPIGSFGAKSFIILSNFFLMRLSFSGVLSGESFGCMQRCYVKQTQTEYIFE